MGCRMPFVETYDILRGLALELNKYKILNLYEADKHEWNDCVINSDLGYVYDFYEMVIECEYEQSCNLTFAIKDLRKNIIILIMPLFNRKSIWIDNAKQSPTFYCRYGPIIRNGLNKQEKKEIKDIFLQNLTRLLELHKQTELYVELAALCSYGFPKYNIVNPFIFWGFEPRIRYTWIVDLSKDEDTLFRNLNRTTRKSIKRISSQSIVYIRESFSNDINNDFEMFVSLSDETYHRNGLLSKSRQYYWNQFHYVSSDKRRIFFLEKFEDGTPEAAMMVHLYNNTARVTWVVSANIKSKDVVRFLIYKVMIELKSSGIGYIEIGGAYPYLPTTDKRRRISDFKKSFGGTLHPIYMGYLAL